MEYFVFGSVNIKIDIDIDAESEEVAISDVKQFIIDSLKDIPFLKGTLNFELEVGTYSTK